MKLRTEGLSWQEIDGELVILDLTRSVYLTTNVAGAVLAKELAKERTVDELVATLQQTFEIEEELARRDTDDFIAQLREKQLLV